MPTRKAIFFLLLLTSLLSFFTLTQRLAAQSLVGLEDERNLVRGDLIRMDVRSTEKEVTYICQLSAASYPYVALQFVKDVTLVYSEIQVFQTLERQEAGINPDGSINYEYIVLPDEVMEGDMKVRREKLSPMPLEREKFILNGKEFITDGQGFITDNGSLGILEFFDDLSKYVFTLDCRHETLGAKKINIYRHIPRRQSTDEKNLEEPVSNDCLAQLGLDFVQRPTESERQLEIKLLDLPSKVRPGQGFEITIEITNNGKRDTSCLLGRLFSRNDVLHGKVFYFGAIKPGKSVRFTRFIALPKNLPTGPVYATLAFNDSWGDIPELKQKLQWECTLKAE